jgi:hypothetical protein
VSKLRAELVWCLIFSLPWAALRSVMPMEQAIDVYGYLLFAAAAGFALSDRFDNGLEVVASAFKCGAVILFGLLPYAQVGVHTPIRFFVALAALACCGVILAVRYAWLLGAKSVQPDGLTRLVSELCSDAKSRPPVRQG